MLVDTDVLIWYLRGNDRASDVLKEQKQFTISVVTRMELVQGMRSKHELNVLRTTLANWRTTVRMIDESISMRAMLYVEQHYHRHRLRLADALIAATAVVSGAPLLTGNEKHYRMISDLTVQTFRPEA